MNLASPVKSVGPAGFDEGVSSVEFLRRSESRAWEPPGIGLRSRSSGGISYFMNRERASSPRASWVSYGDCCRGCHSPIYTGKPEACLRSEHRTEDPRPQVQGWDLNAGFSALVLSLSCWVCGPECGRQAGRQAAGSRGHQTRLPRQSHQTPTGLPPSSPVLVNSENVASLSCALL